MAIINCPECGKKLMEQAVSCPRCGYSFSNIEEQSAVPEKLEQEVRFEPDIIKVELYQLALPAVGDLLKLKKVKREMEECFRKYADFVCSKGYGLAWDILDRAIDAEIRNQASHDEFTKKRANEAALRALSNFNAGINNISTPGLGFSLITGSATHAVAFSALNSFEAHCQEVNQTKALYQKLISDLQAIEKTGSQANWLSIEKIMKAINAAVDLLVDVHQTGIFVSEHEYFYANPDEYDMGLSISGVNLYDLLANAAGVGRRTSGKDYIGDSDVFSRNQKTALFDIRRAGYIKLVLAGNRRSAAYFTTGKYEKEVLEEIWKNAHPDEAKILTDKLEMQYAKAEEELAKGLYYQAATHFAKLDGYRDAMARSITIWKEKLLVLDPVFMSDNYALKSDGSILISDEFLQKFSEEDRQKLISYKCLKQVNIQFETYIILKSDGTVETNKADFGTGVFDQYNIHGNGSDWKNVEQLVFGHSFLAARHKDGTVSLVGDNFDGKCDTSNWTNIKKLFYCYGTLVGLKNDGTIVVTGKLTERFSEWLHWTDIVDIIINSCCIIGLRSDGRVVCSGTWWDQDVISYWKNTAFIHDTYGITRDGDVLYGRKPLDDGRVRLAIESEDLHGIVNIGYCDGDAIVALKADGTVVTKNVLLDLSDWTDVVAFEFCGRSSCVAIKADGTLLIKGTPYREYAKDWKLFGCVDTIKAEQHQALKEYQLEIEQQIALKEDELRNLKGLFVGKKRAALQNSIKKLQDELAALRE